MHPTHPIILYIGHMDTLHSSDPKNVSKFQMYLSYITCDEVNENSPSKTGLSFSACCYRFEALSCYDIWCFSGVFEKFWSNWTKSLTVLKNYKMKSFPHYLLSGFTARKFKLKSSQVTSKWTASIISCFLPILDALCFIHPDNKEGIESTSAWRLL